MRPFYRSFLLSIFIWTPMLLQAQSVTIDLNTEHQTVRGFGGMNHTIWIADLNEDQREKAFGNDPGELGLSILRMHVDPNPDAWDLEVPTALHAKAHGAILFASPWNPPSNLLDQSVQYNRLLPSNYGQYVDHLNAFSSFMADNETSLDAISVQNEPDYGEEGGWTEWSSDEMVNFMRDHAQNLNDPVVAPESFQFIRSYSDPILNDAGAAANLDIMGGHIYGGGLFAYPLAEEKGKEVWMTEHYTSSDRSANLWPDALGVGREIHDCMEANFHAYIWWYIRRFYGLITDDGNISKRGYVFSQFSKFIRPGYQRIDVTTDSGLDISAYKTTDASTVVIVAINNSANETNLDFNLLNAQVDELTMVTTSGTQNMENQGIITVNSGSFSASLPPQSITTFTTNPENTGKPANEHPVANAGEDQEVLDENNDGVETVSLDGRGSTDADGTIVNYSWALNEEQIGFEDSLNVELPTGTHEVILTVTDNDGARSMDTINVDVRLNDNIVADNIWLDVECATVGDNWLINSDNGASSGEYVTATPGLQHLEAASENTEDLLSISFDISEAGAYRLWGRVRAPSPDDDSFWVKMDNGDWVIWNNIEGGADWAWDDIHDSNAGNSAVTYELSPGSHTLYFCFREDGADLDKVLITNTGDTPDGTGEADEACGDDGGGEVITEVGTDSKQKILIYPIPATDEITISARNGFDQFSIYSVNGREVLNIQFQNPVLSKTFSPELAPGLYLIRLRTEEGISTRRILIKGKK